jgi:CheY-like chemotaxis protein
MPHGGRLDVETAVAGAEISLRVIDNGVGMDADTQALIFDPFFTTKDAATGSGLGLSTVYGIVQVLGGSIVVESAPGAGARFEVRLPRVVDEVAVVAVAAVTTSRAGAPESDRLILLVEDQEMLRTSLAQLLRSIGYRVLSAATPLAALEIVEAGARPAVLLTDLMMPHMTGTELAAKLEVRLPGLRVLFMSGNPQDALDERRRSGQPTAFLAKPFTRDDLVRELEGLVDSK